MPKNEDEDDKNEDEGDKSEDEDNEEPEPIDFFSIFSNPEKFINSKTFKRFFNDIIQNLAKNMPELKNLTPEDLKNELLKNKNKFGMKGPFMYGFNVGIGPDGKPTIDSFGNIKTKPVTGKPEVREKREPMIELSEEEGFMVVIAEMPGVTREDIQLTLKPRSLTISAKSMSSQREYFKVIEIPKTVDPNYAKARYKNGVLEVRLKKTEETGTNISVE